MMAVTLIYLRAIKTRFTLFCCEMLMFKNGFDWCSLKVVSISYDELNSEIIPVSKPFCECNNDVA